MESARQEELTLIPLSVGLVSALLLLLVRSGSASIREHELLPDGGERVLLRVITNCSGTRTLNTDSLALLPPLF